MRSMQLPRPARPKPLPRIVSIPKIQIPDLRSLWRGEADYAAFWSVPRLAGTDGEDESFCACSVCACEGAVEVFVWGEGAVG